MSFTGVDYNIAFEKACENLPYVSDADEVRSELEGIEWVLWEAIRGVFFYAALGISTAIVLPVLYFLPDRSLTMNLFSLAVIAIIGASIYWLLRLIFRLEISSHIHRRKFGSGGLK